MRRDLLLAKNILPSLARKVLMPLGLSDVESATDAAIENKIF